MTSPLNSALPVFSQVDIKKIVPNVKAFIEAAHKEIKEICKANDPSWKTILEPLELLDAKESLLWGPIQHLNNVESSKELRAAYDEALPLWSDYHNSVGQNVTLYQAIKKIKDSAEFSQLTVPQKKVVDNALRDFHLSGVDLPDDKKERYRAISEQLSTLCSNFGANVLDATSAYTRAIHDPHELSGLPQWLIEEAQQKAQEKNVTGYLLSLAAPVYMAVMQFADHRPLREDMYVAYITRASELGPYGNQCDNGPVMDKILALRHELAQLLGFKNYAEYSLANNKAAPSTQDVIAFLVELAEKSMPVAKDEMHELQEFAKQHGLQVPLQPWDITYYSEKLSQQKYAYSSEKLREYFPLDTVLAGLFQFLKNLFSIDLIPQKEFDRWNEDALLYHVQDKDGQLHGYLYLDLFARASKQQGAWAEQCFPRYRDAKGQLHLPVTFVCCNFNRPTEKTPALLSQLDIETLFHEFGHALHYVLTEIDEPSIAGTNGVAWDAVEFPSQLMENWCWSQEVLTSLSKHYQTGEQLPDELYQKLLASKHYHCGMQMVRQLEFSLFDFRIHLQYKEGPAKFIQHTLDAVRQQVCVTPVVNYNRFQNSFTHIFDGGYDAGYYSYKWAEVLSANAFQRFEQEGLQNNTLGLEFKNKILSRGGSEDAMTLFVDFMGKKPEMDALLVATGIKAH